MLDERNGKSFPNLLCRWQLHKLCGISVAAPVLNTLSPEEDDVAKEDRGFASMDKGKQRNIASKGGKAAHQKGTAHEWTSEEARDAGRKGGIASHQRRPMAPDWSTRARRTRARRCSSGRTPTAASKRWSPRVALPTWPTRSFRPIATRSPSSRRNPA